MKQAKATENLPGKPLGRRRCPEAHQAILKAAAELLEEKGYSKVCIEAIAARAGVGKQTIYRWWSSKAEVILEAYATQAAQTIPIPNTGCIRQDLCQLLQHLFEILNDASTAVAVTGLIAEAQSDPDLARLFREQFVASRRALTQTLLEQGIARGELRADLDLDLAIDALYGPIWYRLLLKHATLDDRFATALVDQLLCGIKSGIKSGIKN